MDQENGGCTKSTWICTDTNEGKTEDDGERDNGHKYINEWGRTVLRPAITTQEQTCEFLPVDWQLAIGLKSYLMIWQVYWNSVPKENMVKY